MKVTSLKELDNYIYSSVILPLKDLIVEPIRYSSPIIHDGHAITFEIALETVQGNFQHNFQRDSARQSAKQLVYLRHESRHTYIVADYDRTTHDVTLYTYGFKQLKANILFNKLNDAFHSNTPFNKIRTVEGTREPISYIAV